MPSPFNRASSLVFCLLVGALAASCGPREAPEAAALAPSPRVVSLTPSLTALVDGLGRGDHLVGVTRWCERPGVPVVGDMRPDAERVTAARPDLVLAGRYPSLASDVADLRARGLQVLEVPLDSLDDARRAWRAVGDRLDAAAAAAKLVSALDAALADGAARASGRDLVRLLFVFDLADGYVFTTGGGDHLAELATALGALNVADGGPLTSRVALERVLAMAPEVIVHTATSAALPDDAAALAWWKAHAGRVPAAATGRVHVWPDGSLATHGPDLAAAARRLAGLLHP